MKQKMHKYDHRQNKKIDMVVWIVEDRGTTTKFQPAHHPLLLHRWCKKDGVRMGNDNPKKNKNKIQIYLIE